MMFLTFRKSDMVEETLVEALFCESQLKTKTNFGVSTINFTSTEVVDTA